MSGAMEQALVEFLAESRDALDRVETELVALEREPTVRAHVDEVFRALHTIKGTSGFLGCARIEALAHDAEEVLHLAREGRLAVGPALAGALLAAVDALRHGLAGLERTRRDEGFEAGAARAALMALRAGEAPVLPVLEGEASAAPEERVRVDVALLDRLVELAGELVLVRNQVQKVASTRTDANVLGVAQRLDAVTREVQDCAMRTRLQPIGGAFGKLHRLARDVAAVCDKRVRVEVSGGDTELDRSLVDAIRAPLAHLVRNAVDHGIEPVPLRAARGKPPEGRIHLRAAHEAGKVVVEVSDDGGGVELARVAEKAIEGGLATREQLARMAERDVLALVFRPGFSTANAVTAVSGRGVGLDVVKTNVERIGGTVDISSRPGGGTSFTLEIPLTLAIVPALVVESAGQRFCVPQASVLEVVRPGPGALESVLGAPVLRLRGRLLALAALDAVLGLGCGRASSDAHVLVLDAEGKPFGLIVDAVHDVEEVVVKPLGKRLKDLAAYAGAAVLGDGTVTLVLDAAGIAPRGRAGAPPAPERRTSASERRLLLVEVGDGERAALPLEAIARLDEVPRSRVERALGRCVVQHGGRIVPLVDVASILGARPAAREPDPLPLILAEGPSGLVGLVIDRVLDVVEAVPEVHSRGARPGVLGTAVLRERVTELLDLEVLVRAETSA